MGKFAVFATLVGVVAFILAIPMAIIANLFTPGVQVWWATTSSLRRQRRINYLKSQLSAFSDEHNLVFRFECLSRGLHDIFMGWISLLNIIIPLSIGVYLGRFIPPFEDQGTLKYLATHRLLLVGALLFDFALLCSVAIILQKCVSKMTEGLRLLRFSSSTLLSEHITGLQAELDKLCG